MRPVPQRIPQQNGSCSSNSSVASLFTKAVPVMVGTMVPVPRSSQRNLPVNVLPRMLSCTHGAPSASFPSAARHASFALVPVPHGERS